MQTVRMRLPQFTALGDKCYEIGGADTCAQTTESFNLDQATCCKKGMPTATVYVAAFQVPLRLL